MADRRCVLRTTCRGSTTCCRRCAAVAEGSTGSRFLCSSSIVHRPYQSTHFMLGANHKARPLMSPKPPLQRTRKWGACNQCDERGGGGAGGQPGRLLSGGGGGANVWVPKMDLSLPRQSMYINGYAGKLPENCENRGNRGKLRESRELRKSSRIAKIAENGGPQRIPPPPPLH